MCGAFARATIADEMPMPNGHDETNDILGGAIENGDIVGYYDHRIKIRVHRCMRHIPKNAPALRASLVFVPRQQSVVESN